jgi:hypothetical protein
MIEHAIHSILLDNTTLTALTSTRIYYLKAPQDVTLPYVVLTKISSLRFHSHDGKSDLCETRLQMSCFAETYYNSKQVADAVRGVLDAYSGTSESVRIDSCLLINEQDLYESGDGIVHVALDFQIIHNE